MLAVLYVLYQGFVGILQLRMLFLELVQLALQIIALRPEGGAERPLRGHGAVGKS